MDHVEEMKLAAKLAEHPDFMGTCAGGFPLVGFESECRFCGATADDMCKRAKQEVEPKAQ